MQHKTSLFNKGILLNNLKRFWWIGIVYLLVLLFDVPLKILMILGNNTEESKRCMRFIFHFRSEAQIFPMIAVPVITAVALFRYIQNKKSADMVHSLPIKRLKLYDNHIFTGVILLVIPVIITGLIALILKISLNLNDAEIYYTVRDILLWAGTTILFNVFIFLFSVLIGMLTGLSTAQGILTYIFLFLPFGLSILIIYNLRLFIYGFSTNHHTENQLESFSPLTRISNLHHKPINLTEILIYIVLCMILYTLARFIYSKRKSESASKAVAFSKLQPIFKYGITFCCMLVGGIYFGYMQNNIYWILFGYTAASLIGYYIAEIIINKSLKVFKNVKGYFVFAAVVVLVLLGINLDIAGYKKRIPDLDAIENIYFANYFYDYDLNYESKNNTNFYIEKENIENIQKLHKKLIDDSSYLAHSPNSYDSICLAYNLKNGKQIKREYLIPEDMYAEYLKPIYESLEYKKMHCDILSINHTSVDKIRINTCELSKEVSITSPSEIKEAIAILKNEKINETYEEMQDERRDWANIDILLNNDERIDLSWKKSYMEFEEWLAKKDYIKNARVIPDDIDYIVVEEESSDISTSNSKVTIYKVKKRFEIHDKDKIEICLRSYTWRHRGEYIIGFYTKDNRGFYASFDKKHIPDFIDEYFK